MSKITLQTWIEMPFKLSASICGSEIEDLKVEILDDNMDRPLDVTDMLSLKQIEDLKNEIRDRNIIRHMINGMTEEKKDTKERMEGLREDHIEGLEEEKRIEKKSGREIS